ncbi:general substrate transporter [Aspergillus pseudodeflectus]|uniref:General substrate transporter n=1 Tax=Aspergillus pseudodeflectus TaxID=176178 RepID=A0ABR4JPJ0_9EURO
MSTNIETDVTTLAAGEVPKWYHAHILKLNLLLLSPFVTMAAWGFDISMTNSLQSLTAFNEKFDHPSGARLGFFGASTQVGGAVTIFIAPFLIEKFGRRPMCFIGSIVVIAMAIMQVFSRSFDMFTAAKLILGFGANCSQISAPMLITELAHPIQRAKFTAMYNTTIYVGLIAGAWIAYGTRNIEGNLSWQIPCVLQVVLPAYQAFTIFLCPESPRWLVMRGKLEQAQNILIKYHGNGTHTPLVQAELEEIIAGIEADASRIRLNKTDIKALLSHKGNLHRILIITIVGVGSQCTGSGLISAYLPKVLDGIGMTSTTDKTLINGILNIWTWIVGLSAGYLMPKIKKRALFLTATTGMILALSVWTGLTAAYDRDARYSYGIGVVAMMFVYNLFYGICWLPLVTAYSIEICTAKQRSILFSWLFFSISMSTFAVNYINPVGLENIQWRYYIITIVFTVLILVLVWFFFVETRGLSLEEIATVFDGRERYEAALESVQASGNKMDDEEVEMHHVERGV